MKRRTGLIGLGKHAIEHHLPALKASLYADLVAVCDPDDSRLIGTGLSTNFPFYRSAACMLSECPLDLVVVAVPHHEYAEILSLAANFRLNVIKEKPFARDSHEAQIILHEFALAERCVMTHVQRRYHPTFRRLKALLPTIGNVFWAEFKYTRYVEYLNQDWRAKKDLAGGGCIIDMGYHMIDLILWYLGFPKSVHAVTTHCAVKEAGYDAEDSAQIHLSYEPECMVTCLLSRRCPPKTESMRFIGTAGILEFDNGVLTRRDSSGALIEVFPMEAGANHIDEECRRLDNGENYHDISKSHLDHVVLVEACYLSAQRRQSVEPKSLLGEPQCGR